MKLIIIAGPTASGKTQLAFDLAKQLKCEIIYADSRSVYKYMDIGTAKPPKEMQQQIKHHLIDIIEPDTIFSATDFAKKTEEIILNKLENSEYIIITGGTGFYINTYLEGIAPVPNIEDKIKQELRNFYYSEGLKAIRELLKAKDPKAYNVIDKNNPARILRALEVITQTGKSITYFWNLPKKKFYIPEKIYKFYLDVSKEQLSENIRKRTEEMLKKGLVEETTFLLKKYPENIPAFNTIGYKQVIEFLKNDEESYDDLLNAIIKATEKYAKRQKTWFKKYYKNRIKIANYKDIEKIYRVISE